MFTLFMIAAGLVVLAMYLVFVLLKAIWWILDCFVSDEKMFPVFMLILAGIVILVIVLISSL